MAAGTAVLYEAFAAIHLLMQFIDFVCLLKNNCMAASTGLAPSGEQVAAEIKAAIATAAGPTLVCLDGKGGALKLAHVQLEVFSTAQTKGGGSIRLLCKPEV